MLCLKITTEEKRASGTPRSWRWW